MGSYYPQHMGIFPSPPVAGAMGTAATERLLLRPPTWADHQPLAAIFAQPQVWHYPYGRGVDSDETAAFLDTQIRHWDETGFGLWLVEQRHTTTLIGYVGLSVPTFLPELLPAVEVGWRLAPAYWGHGYATEAARAALDAGFTILKLSQICSLPQDTNAASLAVCERLGMTAERTVCCPATTRRGPVQAVLYCLTVAHWGAQAQPSGHGEHPCT